MIIGAPVRNRAWILPDWHEHVLTACKNAGVVPSFVFVAGSSVDETDDILESWEDTQCIRVDESPMPIDVDGNPKNRQWRPERFRHMVEVRNLLLGMVQSEQPDYFLSLDTDILLHDQAILNLLETSESYDAVGGKVYLGKGRTCPSFAQIIPSNRQMLRPDSDGVFPVDVIMAAKLMKPAAYSVPYRYDSRGEDIGWSLNCHEHGLKLGWDGRITSKHVMFRSQLHEVDGRLGW